MRIGVAAPCHTDDEKFVKVFLQCLDDMSPQPYARCIHVNDGSKGLGHARSFAIDYLFDEMNCDIVLNASIDHYLFPDILRHVQKDRITGFGYLALKPATVVTVIKRLFSRYAWTGVYAVPKNRWSIFKKSPFYVNWDGEGDSLQWWALENDIPISRVRLPKYWLLRYSERMKEFAVELGGWKAVSKLMDAW